MKKILILLSSLAIGISLLTGCSTTEEDTSTDVTNGVSDTVEDESSETDESNEAESTLLAYKITEVNGDEITVIDCELTQTKLDEITIDSFIETETEETISLSDYSEIILADGSYDLAVDDYIVSYLNSEGTLSLKVYH